MIVDMLLRVLGKDMLQYQSTSDKWIAFWVIVWGYSTYSLCYILAVLPWFWLLWRKYKKKSISRKMVVFVLMASVVLFYIGYNLPWWFIEIIGGLGVRGLYGGQI